MEFVVKLYRKQVEGGGVLVHESPAHAKSWGLPVIRMMMREVDVVERISACFDWRLGG